MPVGGEGSAARDGDVPAEDRCGAAAPDSRGAFFGFALSVDDGFCARADGAQPVIADDAAENRDRALRGAFGTDRDAHRRLDARELLCGDPTSFQTREHLLPLRPSRDHADPSRKAPHAVEQDVRIDAVRVAEEHDVAVGLQTFASKEVLGTGHEAPLRVREALRRCVLRAVVEHRVRVLELIAEPRDLQADVTTAAHEHVWPRPSVLDEDLDTPAAQAVEPARAEASEVEPDRSAGAVGDALPTKCLHLLLETRTADGSEARPVGEDDHLGTELAGDAALDRRDRAQRAWRSRRDELRCLAHHPQRQFHGSTGAARDQPPPWCALALERKMSRQRA